MSSGLLDFFTLEATEYVEHLDEIVARSRGGIPDFESCARHARSLRGSATMAKIGGIADVASALERIAHALQAGTLQWNDALRGAYVAAVDDLKILIRGVRAWGDAEKQRAAARAQELATFAPAATAGTSPASSPSSFLAKETGWLGDALEAFAENPVGPSGFASTLQRVRALRGVALIKEVPPLPEIVDALDAGAKSFELSGVVTPALRALFGAAATVLSDASVALLRGDRPATESPALAAFATAASALGGSTAAADEIVPVSSLFFDDGAPGLVTAASSPPTTAAQRFRMEVVSHAEHLRRLVADAGRSVDSATRERVARELGAATRALAKLSASFGESELAAFFERHHGQVALLAGAALDALDHGCQMLSAPHGKSTADIVHALVGAAALREPTRAPTPPVPTFPAPAPVAATVAARPTPAAPVVDIASLAPAGQPSLLVRATPERVPAAAAPVVDIATLAPDGQSSLVERGAAPTTAPSGDALSAMLARGIEGLSGLDAEPLAEPAAFATDVTVPIEDLVYRGRDALDRAIEIRDVIRQSAGTPDPALLAELFDLLELAATSE